MQNTVNKPNKNSIKKKHGHTHRHNKKKENGGVHWCVHLACERRIGSGNCNAKQFFE
jgi:hypothetical protein